MTLLIALPAQFQRFFEERRSCKRSHRPPGDLHDDQPVHQAVGMVGDHQGRPLRDSLADATHLVEAVHGPQGASQYETRGRGEEHWPLSLLQKIR